MLLLLLLSYPTKYQEEILAALADFPKLLQDEDSSVRRQAAFAFAELSKQAQLQDAILPAVPDFMKLLQDVDVDVRWKAASAFTELSKQGILLTRF
jgi:HEAT repeat protein